MAWWDWSRDAGLVLLVVDVSARLALAVRVILRRTPVPVTLSWLLVLLFLPVFSWLLYLLVGEPRLGSRRARAYEELTERIEQEAVLHWGQGGMVRTPEQEPERSLAHLTTSVTGMPPLGGNEIELLGTGSSVLERIVEDIDRSRKHCHLLFYIWQATGTAGAVGEALIRAAERGVACRVLVDAVGSRPFLRSDLRARMDRAGVRVVAALPVNPVRMLLARVDLRNHRKVAVFDGEVAYCGSQNMTDETFRVRGRAKVGPWIDATVRLRGPAVQALQTVFLRDWMMDSDERPEHAHEFFAPPAPVAGGGSIVHVVPSGPGPHADAIHQALLAMLYGAREEILMTTPYFVPDEATKSALLNAALRGVEVTLVLPDVLDARLVAAAARAHYDDLLAAGVRIAHHREGLLHAKAATIDRRMAMLGSANFDMRSFWLNFESTLFVYDADFAGRLRFMQRHYLNESQMIDPRAWRRRPIVRRFVDNCAQLLNPLL